MHSCSFENGSRWPTGDGENFPHWLIGLLSRVAAACIKTAAPLGQAHNELSDQIGNPSQLRGNKQWLVNNGGWVQLSSSCTYISITSLCSVCADKTRCPECKECLMSFWEFWELAKMLPQLTLEVKTCCMDGLFHCNHKGIQQLRYMWLEMHNKGNKAAKNKYTC